MRAMPVIDSAPVTPGTLMRCCTSAADSSRTRSTSPQWWRWASSDFNRAICAGFEAIINSSVGKKSASMPCSSQTRAISATVPRRWAAISNTAWRDEVAA